MIKYTFTQARQNFASVLNKANDDGEVMIQKKDGSSYIIKPFKRNISPLNVKGVNINISLAEIKDIIKESRER